MAGIIASYIGRRRSARPHVVCQGASERIKARGVYATVGFVSIGALVLSGLAQIVPHIAMRNVRAVQCSQESGGNEMRGKEVTAKSYQAKRESPQWSYDWEQSWSLFEPPTRQFNPAWHKKYLYGEDFSRKDAKAAKRYRASIVFFASLRIFAPLREKIFCA